MSMMAKVLTAAAFLGGMVAPAAGQYPYSNYPNQPYPYQGYPNQGYPNQGYNQNSIGGIIDALIGNRYAVGDRTAIRQCAIAAVNEAQRQYRPGNNNYGYNQPYQNYRNDFRVTAITDVNRRSSGLRVEGLINSGRYGYDQRYANNGDLSFRCSVDYRGYVTNVRVRPNNAWRRY
jgi:hypothetical protein